MGNKNNLEETLQIAKEMKEISNCLLASSDLTEEEFERRLQDPDYYPQEIKELIENYQTKVELAVQHALDVARKERLKKEEVAYKATMSRWIHVK